MLQTGGMLSDYPDFIAFAVVVVVVLFTGVGAKASVNFNSTFVVINLCVITFIVCYGLSFADISLWTPFNERGKGD
jgi:amino acid transporter